MKLDANNVTEYYEKVPEGRKEAMLEIRELIIENAQDVTEAFKNKLPFYDIDDKPFIALASQKHHISFYLAEPDLVEKYKSELGKVGVAKSCIRIKKYEQLNKDTLISLIKEAYKRRVTN